MIPTIRNQEVKTNATGETMSMGLDAEDIQHLLPILRDSLYANKILAPIREYSTNARDSHTAFGKAGRPIRVTLPTRFEPEFRIRDFGTSLSLDEVKNTYLKYCKSTKRTSNDFNGVYGLGCKSAFAYTDQFTVITYLDGQQTIINIPISGEAQVIAQVPTTEEQGLEIVIPVNIKDVDAWHEEAMAFYAYWSVRPTIVNQRQDLFEKFFSPLQIKPIFSQDDWEVRPGGYNNRSKAVAVMSYVPYPINWETVKRNFSEEQTQKYGKILGFVENNYVTFMFSNGTADFTPSREALQYTETTLASICHKLDKISDAIEKIISERISSATNLWEAKCLYNKVFNGSSYDRTEGNFYGNLGQIQTMMSGKLKWNGIGIDDGKFSDIHLWDRNTGKIKDGTHYDSSTVVPIFSSITVEDNTKKTVMVSGVARYGNQSLLASERALVLILDAEDTYKAAAGRYLFFEAYLDKNINTIYVLDLSNPTVKKEFYKHYKFDSVPVILASQIENQVKAFIAANKIVRAASEQVKAPYIDMAPYFDAVDGKKDVYYIDFVWNKDVVPPKDVVGGIYIQATQKEANYLDRSMEIGGSGGYRRRYRSNYSANEMKNLLLNFARLCRMTGKKVDRIYGIQPRTVDSKWFKEEIADGTWVDMASVAAAEFSKLDMSKASLAMDYKNSLNESNTIRIEVARTLTPLISDTNNPIHKYVSMVSSELSNYSHVPAMAESLLDKNDKNFKIVSAGTQIEKVVKSIKKLYPMISMFPSNHYLFMEDEEKIKRVDLKAIAEYINAMDTVKAAQSQQPVAV